MHSSMKSTNSSHRDTAARGRAAVALDPRGFQGLHARRTPCNGTALARRRASRARQQPITRGGHRARLSQQHRVRALQQRSAQDGHTSWRRASQSVGMLLTSARSPTRNTCVPGMPELHSNSQKLTTDAHPCNSMAYASREWCGSVFE